MAFNPLPQTWQERLYSQLAHSQRMLSLVDEMGNWNANPLPQYDWFAKAQGNYQAANANNIESLLQGPNPGMPNPGGAIKGKSKPVAKPNQHGNNPIGAPEFEAPSFGRRAALQRRAKNG